MRMQCGSVLISLILFLTRGPAAASMTAKTARVHMCTWTKYSAVVVFGFGFRFNLVEMAKVQVKNTCVKQD